MSDKIKTFGSFKLIDFDINDISIGSIVFNVKDDKFVYKSRKGYKNLDSDVLVKDGSFKRLIFEEATTNLTYLLDIDLVFIDQLQKYEVSLKFENFKTNVILIEFDKTETTTYSCYLNIILEPKIGNFCLHYNYLSEILEVDIIKDLKSEYVLKMKTFYDDGTMIHSSSIYTLINCNKQNLIKSLLK